MSNNIQLKEKTSDTETLTETSLDTGGERPAEAEVGKTPEIPNYNMNAPICPVGQTVNNDFMFKNGLPRWYSSSKIRVDFVPHNRTERGVFASEDMAAGEVLEEVPFINVDNHYEKKMVFDFLSQNQSIGSSRIRSLNSFAKVLGIRSVHEYLFNWSSDNAAKDVPRFSVIPLGNGCIYNSSPLPNAEWYTTQDSFIFRLKEDVNKGEEIRTFYGYFLTETSSKIIANDVLGLYVELNENNKICLRTMPVDNSMNFLSFDKHVEINNRCKQGDVYVNRVEFFSAEKALMATLKAHKVQSTDFFYSKILEAKMQTNFFYIDVELQFTKEKNKKETLTLYNR